MVPEAGLRASACSTVQGVRRSASLANVEGRRRRSAPAVPRADGAVAPAATRRSWCRSAATPACPPVLAAKVARASRSWSSSYDAVPGRGQPARRPAGATASAVAFDGVAAAAQGGDRSAPAARRSSPSTSPATGPRPAAELGLPADRFVLLVVGGSLGSGTLNEVIGAFAARQRRPRRPRRPPRRRAPATTTAPRDSARSTPAPDGLVYQAVRYEDRMHLAYAAADLVVARAGATTVAELAALGLPVDPRAVAARHRGPPDGQRPGRWPTSAAAVLVPEAELTAERLAGEVDRLAADRATLAAMAARASALGHRDAADRIAALADEVAAAGASPGSPPTEAAVSAGDAAVRPWRPARPAPGRAATTSSASAGRA